MPQAGNNLAPLQVKVFRLLPQATFARDISVTRDIFTSLLDSVPYPRARKAFGAVGIQTHLRIIMTRPQFPILLLYQPRQGPGCWPDTDCVGLSRAEVSRKPPQTTPDVLVSTHPWVLSYPLSSPRPLVLLVHASPLLSWLLESRRWGWQKKNEVIYSEKMFCFCDCCCCSLANGRNDRNICEELAKWVADGGVVKKLIPLHSCRCDGRLGAVL